ncbi:6-methylsalicylic acid synthase [Massarina eburnea CBS 473.64]|uniref:6-methylsalicylic acid synthase n=1 Tax=Massarina eburnea CBS 473.64 TaxID=1395130 RepID=A0A6A6RM09_9PLEO|nr:6-methylsalicylic acid synthase [Massarina eburnea CBS 473.64]
MDQVPGQIFNADPSGTPFSSPTLSESKVDTPTTTYNEQTHYNDVAVIGMACRVAGNNNSPSELWDFITSQKDASGEMPSWRWEPYLRRDSRNAAILSSTTSRGYFLGSPSVEDFDPVFFGISPKEAAQMDPQQRISLEVAWEALENAGIPPQSLSGSDTAVFWGLNSDDYSKLVLEDLPNVDAWMGIGTAYCGVPNRISYHMNLMGPSTAVDAACASSLVAIHHGRQAILQHESQIAIVGGVNVMCGPGLTRVLDKAGAISHEGRCRSFDDEANGYGRGEGAGVVILKNMQQALRDGDQILAILKGSAVAQDGRTNGIMAPNAKAQELVANQALRVANIEPSTVRYVEAHATSTPIGDPTEVAAVASVYGKARAIGDPCYIGSVKPNIGHLEAGAGVMGFIKAVLAVQKGVLPPQTNLSKLNSRIDWKSSNVIPVQKAMPWPIEEDVRRAAICSYGYGGTTLDFPHSQLERPTYVTLILSAPQEKGLALQAAALRSWLVSDGSQHSIEAVATTLATRRGHHDYRAALVVDSTDDAVSKLGSFCDGSSAPWISQSRIFTPEVKRDAVWVFSGHGAQWAGMGREMLEDPTFESVIMGLEPIVQKEMGFSAMDALRGNQDESTERVQVLTYLMQIGLSAVLKNRGIVPQAIIGHSVGEIAASVVAEALTPEEGALVVCRRAVLYRRVMGEGAMVLVSKTFSEVREILGDREDIVAAIDSSTSSCVVSGSQDSMAKFLDDCKANGTKAVPVKTDIAFHSPLLRRLIEPLLQELKDCLSPRPPIVKLLSTSLTDPWRTDLRNAQYWVDNMVNPVRLTQAVHAALDDGFRAFLEVSTHPIVTYSINETIMDRQIEDSTVIATMLRNKPSEKCILHGIAQLHCIGAAVDWKRQMPGEWTSELPTTKWNHRPIWSKVETGRISAGITHDVTKHTLLGQGISVAESDMTIYTTSLDDNTKPFPGAHPLHGTEIVPAAALINTFLHGSAARSLHNVVLRVPVAIGAPRDIQVTVHQGNIRLSSRLIQTSDGKVSDNASWVTHTTAQLKSGQTGAVPSPLDLTAIQNRISARLPNDFAIQYLDKVGVSAMGFPWAITEHWGNTREMLARVDVAPSLAPDAALPWDQHSWAPILDAATSVGSTIFFDEPRLRMPAQIDSVHIFTQNPPPKTGWLYCEAFVESLSVNVSIVDENGAALASFDTMRFSEIEGTPGASSSVESLVHQIAWPPVLLAENPLVLNKVFFVSENTDLISEHAKRLPATTVAVEIVLPNPNWDALLSLDKDDVVIYVPGKVTDLEDVSAASQRFASELLDIIKRVIHSGKAAKVFAITNDVAHASTPTALAQASLLGISRIISCEHPDHFGGLIDAEDDRLPLQAIKYAQGIDVIRISDGVARAARLRPLRRERLLPSDNTSTLLPRPEGTYLITGGTGALGLEVAKFLVEKNARRLILVSRRGVPPRKQWGQVQGPIAIVVDKIRELERQGASVHVINADVCDGEGLAKAIGDLSLPPVLGVVHAAGVLEDQLILDMTADSLQRVTDPKITGALTLHALFPPKALDFMVLFSSCGQLFGFPGQGSYAAGNAFLDTLSTHRRNLGDNTVAMQWTSWRGLGMAASTEYINAELESKGITDVTCEDAFRAWTHLSRFDMDHGVVLRSVVFNESELVPHPILTDIAIRRSGTSTEKENADPSGGPTDIPTSGEELKAYLTKAIRECVSKVLQLGVEDVDTRAALSDLGIDSVMTVTLRKQLQQSLKVKVPPTLTWNYPTVGHLVGWFAEKLAT